MPDAIGFDIYGTLVDPLEMNEHLLPYAGEKADRPRYRDASSCVSPNSKADLTGRCFRYQGMYARAGWILSVTAAILPSSWQPRPSASHRSTSV